MVLAGFGIVLVFISALLFGIIIGFFIIGRSQQYRAYWDSFCRVAGLARSECVYTALHAAFIEEFGHLPRWAPQKKDLLRKTPSSND